jgi:hypothetical protein
MAILTRRPGSGRADVAWWRRVVWLAGLAMLGGVMPRVLAQPAASTEYQLKAAFLYKLAQFVEWPERAFRAADAPLVVGVLGEDPFGTYLDELVKGEKVGERPLIVRRFKRAEDIGECHILFISRSEVGTLDKALALLRGRSVLTVGDTDTFTQQGGMVRFATESGKIRLKVSVANVEADKASELKPSSKILSPANIVPPGKD